MAGGSPKFSQIFIEALKADFCAPAELDEQPAWIKRQFEGRNPTNGEVALAFVRRKRPATYAQVCSNAIPKEVILNAGDDLAAFLEQVQARRFELANPAQPALEHIAPAPIETVIVDAEVVEPGR